MPGKLEEVTAIWLDDVNLCTCIALAYDLPFKIKDDAHSPTKLLSVHTSENSNPCICCPMAFLRVESNVQASHFEDDAFLVSRVRPGPLNSISLQYKAWSAVRATYFSPSLSATEIFLSRTVTCFSNS